MAVETDSLDELASVRSDAMGVAAVLRLASMAAGSGSLDGLEGGGLAAMLEMLAERLEADAEALEEVAEALQNEQSPREAL